MTKPTPVLLIKPSIASPLEGWSWYGAHQLMEIGGIPFSECEAGSWADLEEQGRVVVVPNSAHPRELVSSALEALAAGKTLVVGSEVAIALLQEGLDIGAQPHPLVPLPPTEPSELLCLRAYALLPAAFTETTLPLLGEPIVFTTVSSPLGFLRTLDGRQGALAWVHRVSNGTLVVLGGRIWETCGLLLSRFSWFANPYRRDSFLRQVDPLWDKHLKPWHRFPVVSFYAQFFLWLLSAVLWDQGECMPLKWWLPHEESQPFRMGLIGLHDVEKVFSDSFAQRAENPCYRFADWLDLENRLGIRSAFFFLSPVTALPPHWRLNYDLTDEAVLAALDLVEERGGEIGLLSIACASEHALAMERERLEDLGGVFVWGVRSYHFGNTPASVRHKSKVGFVYDSSWFVGQSMPSFLTGSTHPFRPLDAERWEVLPLVELSAILDDRVLWGDLDDLPSNSDLASAGLAFCEAVLAMGGILCLSWQQHTFEQRAPLYEQLVEHCRKAAGGDVWFPAPKEVGEWWVKRNEVRLSCRSVRPRWWVVEVAAPEELDEPFTFVLALPAPKELQVLQEGTPVRVHRLGSLGGFTVWGVPLILEPEETVRLSIALPS